MVSKVKASGKTKALSLADKMVQVKLPALVYWLNNKGHVIPLVNLRYDMDGKTCGCRTLIGVVVVDDGNNVTHNMYDGVEAKDCFDSVKAAVEERALRARLKEKRSFVAKHSHHRNNQGDKIRMMQKYPEETLRYLEEQFLTDEETGEPELAVKDLKLKHYRTQARPGDTILERITDKEFPDLVDVTDKDEEED